MCTVIMRYLCALVHGWSWKHTLREISCSGLALYTWCWRSWTSSRSTWASSRCRSRTCTSYVPLGSICHVILLQLLLNTNYKLLHNSWCLAGFSTSSCAAVKDWHCWKTVTGILYNFKKKFLFLRWCLKGGIAVCKVEICCCHQVSLAAVKGD